MRLYLSVVLTVLVLVVDLSLAAAADTGVYEIRVTKERTIERQNLIQQDEPNPPKKNLTIRTFVNVNETKLSGNQIVSPYVFNDNPNLKWQWYSGSLPDGAVGIWNSYTGRYDYVCRTFDGCETGFFHRAYGDCLFPRYPTLYGTNGFFVLVNTDDFVFLEWKFGSYGSVPPHSVRTCSVSDRSYVGMNEYGLGLISSGDSFYLPWVQKYTGSVIYGYAEWYKKSYHALTINSNKYSQKIIDIEYYIDQAKLIESPPFAVDEHTVSNEDCNSANMKATLSTTQTKTNDWQMSYSMSLAISTSFDVGIPEIFEAEISIGVTQTFEVSEGMSFSQSQTNSLEVSITVPPNKKCHIQMQGKRFTMDIPFKARLGRTYSNGETRWTTITGTYKGVQVTNYNAVINRCEMVDNPVPCRSLLQDTPFSCNGANV